MFFQFKAAFTQFQRRVAPEHENLTQKEVYLVFAHAIKRSMTAEQKARVDAEMAVLRSERFPQPKTIFCTHLSILNA
jgi:hypothetical protein